MQGYASSPRTALAFLLHHLPCTLPDMKTLRRSILGRIFRDADLRNGMDGSKARKNLSWWLQQGGRGSAVSTWPQTVCTKFYCRNCAGVMPHKRCLDPRVHFCDTNCRSAYRYEPMHKRRRVA